ncbi:DUF3806 domain-containing protein [Micrococcus lacusdianchii]|uniref:DUF3806 domain-containing protein n=1 Tax=Micrococcus lacusdianchii TaxID=2915940 RepID=UPI00200588B5|nr:DUF3806 domain-containing protein [Micrococcus sp. JXJ CY 30]
MTDAPQLSPLTEPEQQWVDVRRAYAEQEGVGHLDLDAVEAFYDGLVSRSEAEEVDPEELGALLDVVAVLLGEHLGARHGLQWVSVREEHGTDLGLRDPLSDAVVFPHAVVGAHWNEGTTGWMGGHVDALGEQLQEIRAQRAADGFGAGSAEG